MLRKCGLLTLCLALLGSSACVLALGNHEDHAAERPGKVYGVSGEKDLEIKQNGGALVLRTDSGKRYSVTASESGQLIVSPIQ